MDPALWNLMESGPSDEEVSVIVRLRDANVVPSGIRVVANFGTILTARLPRGGVQRLWEDDGVISVKAPRVLLSPAPFEDDELDAGAEESASAQVPPLPSVPEDGRGVVVGICDWGFDFTHANFRRPDGTTRLRALWDQRGHHASSPAPYGYGRVHRAPEIDAALRSADPFAALDYDPSHSDPGGQGSHGTHVADILAGNRREPGSSVGLAGGADLIFVHLSADPVEGLANFGDSVRLLEGLDFVRREAGDAPCVMHLSAGKTGGAHCGETPFEQAVDAMVASRPGLALIQSVGNYADSAMHTHVRIGPDQSHVIVWLISPRDQTPNELELWYSGHDVLDATLVSPGGVEFDVPLGQRTHLRHRDEDWGSFHHRFNEPNSGMNHIDIFLHRSAPAGRWRLALRGREIVDGRLHAWIERDARGRHQSRFLRSQATSRYTTNTIANSFRAIAVGAYDAGRPERPAAYFSSRGPTADGRQKPELVAPGFRIQAARSTPRGGWPSDEPRLTVKSGTSMAAPWVSGTVALMFQAAGRPLGIHEIRSLLIGTADPLPDGPSSTRLGYGYLNPAAAVDAARRIGAEPPPPRRDVAAGAAPRARDPAERPPIPMPGQSAAVRTAAPEADTDLDAEAELEGDTDLDAEADTDLDAEADTDLDAEADTEDDAIGLDELHAALTEFSERAW